MLVNITAYRADLVQDDYAQEQVDFTSLRIWDAYQTALGSAGSDDLGLTAGAFGTGCPYVTGGDCKTITATRYARFEKTLGPEYVDGESIRLNIVAGMLTAIADTTATVDVEAYLEGGDTLKSGSDLVTTGLQSINSLTFATFPFEITGSGRSRGDKLDIRIKIAVIDAAGGSAVIPAIAKIAFLKDIKG